MPSIGLPIASTTDFETVAVFDDDTGQAATAKLQLADIGVTALIADLDKVSTLELAVEWTSTNAQAAICDVQLNNLHGGVGFTGSQLVSQLVSERKCASVLTTGFIGDVGMWVRPYRKDIPVLLLRDQTEDPEAFVDGLESCAAEITQGRPPERETSRVPLFIEKAGFADRQLALDARVGGWMHTIPMRFPADMLNLPLDESAARDLVGKVFFAHVNLGAEREADLFFEEPEPEFFDAADVDLHFGDPDS